MKSHWTIEYAINRLRKALFDLHDLLNSQLNIWNSIWKEIGLAANGDQDDPHCGLVKR